MHVNMIINALTVEIINKRNVIAMYWSKSQTTSHGLDLHKCVLGLLFANTAAIKIISKYVKIFIKHVQLRLHTDHRYILWY